MMTAKALKLHKSRHIILTCVLIICALLAPGLPVSPQTAAASALPVAQNIMFNVRVPSTGNLSVSGSGATIDLSNTSEGYIMAKYLGSGSKIKLQITRGEGTTYTYNLNSSGKYEVFPLTAGNGSYTINVYENVYGNQYAMLTGTTTDVSLSNDRLPFLYPNQYVNFTSESATVKKGEELASGAVDQLAVISNVYNYVISNITYDDYKAANVKSGYLPVVDTILEKGKGICFDYAAVMASMLRSQDIPTRLQVGYVSGGLYHAWISVYTDKTGWINGIIYFDGTSWKLMDPTFAAGSSQSSETMKFIGNGSNYSTVYIY